MSFPFSTPSWTQDIQVTPNSPTRPPGHPSSPHLPRRIHRTSPAFHRQSAVQQRCKEVPWIAEPHEEQRNVPRVRHVRQVKASREGCETTFFGTTWGVHLGHPRDGIWDGEPIRTPTGGVLFFSGWWLTYPSEKYESWDYIWKNKKCSKPPTSFGLMVVVKLREVDLFG